MSQAAPRSSERSKDANTHFLSSPSITFSPTASPTAQAMQQEGRSQGSGAGTHRST